MSEASARQYHRLRLTYFFLGLFLQGFVWVFLWRSGLSEFFLRVSAPQRHVFHAPAYFLLVYLTLAAMTFPLDIASGFFLEKRFALSRQSAGAWLKDYAKKNVLSFFFFLLTATAFFSAVRLWPGQWWWALALGVFVLSAVLTTVFPVLILPLFYPSRPLEGALRDYLLGWCRDLKTPVLGIYEIAFSRKTVKANAALTGFGKTRRVLLADTLLKGFSVEEIKMVLAHEIGHQVKRHLLQGLLWDLAAAFIGFYALFLLAGAVADLAHAQTLGDIRVLPVLSLLAFLASVLGMPLRNTMSRRYEREADYYALTVFPKEPVFFSLMVKLAETNLTVRSVSRWEEVFLLDHPSIDRRLESARSFFDKRPC